jgi:hypothetical protein
MFFFSPPTLPPQEAPAQATQKSHASVMPSITHAIGICQPVSTFQTPPPIRERGDYAIDPIFQARNYFSTYKHMQITEAAEKIISSQPKNGSLISDGDAYIYLPNPNYLGSDGATFLVNLGDKKVSVIYYFYVTPGQVQEGEDTADGGARYRKLCPHGYSWKISTLSPGWQQRFR